MRKLLLVVALIMIFAPLASAEWTGTVADRNVSYYSGDGKLAWYSRVAIGPEGNLYLIWRQGQSLQPYEIFFGMSTDNGATWSSESADRQISPVNGVSISNVGDRPLDIDMDNSGNIFVVWAEDHIVGTDTCSEIMLMKSTDQGTTWLHSDANFPISHLGVPIADAYNPSMATDYLNNIYVVWHQRNSVDTSEICFAKSTDGGDTWSSQSGDRFISYTDGFHAANPDIFVDRNNSIYVVWDERESSDLASAQILYGKSTDGGATFNSETADLPTSVGIRSTSNPYIVADLQDNIYITWRGTNATASPFLYEAFFTSSTDGGATWSGNAGQIRVDPGVGDGMSVNYPAIAVTSTGNLAIVWNEEIDYPQEEIFASYSFDGGVTWTGTTAAEQISFNDNRPAYRPDIFCSRGDTLHVFWNEGISTNGYYDIHYSKGDTLGTAAPTEGTIDGHVFETDGSTPIVDVQVETFDSLDQRVAVDTTDASGHYEVILFPGSYWELFTKTGYEDFDTTGIVIAPGMVTPIVVEMAIVTGCQYTPGDINGNGFANGIDVVYGVNYFKGSSAPPITCPMCPQPAPFYAAGDVNGNCSFNGIDISFFVNYLKGIQPALLYCPSCAPVTR